MQQEDEWFPYYRLTNYTVKPGDSLYKIAKKFNTTVPAIKRVNNLKSDALYVGQSLIMPPTLPDGTYGIGSTGPNIKRIQEALSILGFNVKPDGIYGPNTANAILTLQKKFPELLVADGVYGPKTKKVIEKLISSNYKIVKNPESKTVLVNKLNSLPSDYVPKNLTVPDVPFSFPEFRMQRLMDAEAAKALEDLFAKAEKDGIALNAISGYRSYDYQNQLFTRNIKANPNANQFSARPGESEHQTGLAVDVSSPSVNNSLTQSFGDTKEGKWLAENAPEFGFILRFPKGKEHITGYQYEPWHLRYVGKDIAKQITNQNLTYEEYLGKVNQ